MVYPPNKGIPAPGAGAPEEGDYFSGPAILWINPGAHFAKVMDLRLSLSTDPNIEMISSGSGMGSGSYLRLNIKKPIPLFEYLLQIPGVSEISKEGNDIHIHLH